MFKLIRMFSGKVYDLVDYIAFSLLNINVDGWSVRGTTIISTLLTVSAVMTILVIM